MRAMVLPKVVSLNDTDSPLQLLDLPIPSPKSGEVRLRVPLDDPLELFARLWVLLLEEEPLALLVELGGGGDGVGATSESAAGREQKQDAGGGEESSPERPSPRIARAPGNEHAPPVR